MDYGIYPHSPGDKFEVINSYFFASIDDKTSSADWVSLISCLTRQRLSDNPFLLHVWKGTLGGKNKQKSWGMYLRTFVASDIWEI